MAEHNDCRPGGKQPELVAAGVEEEFHTVDLGTRRLTAQAGKLMAQLPAGRFGSELQRSVLEANSRPWARLTDLAGDIAALRRAAITAAGPLGLGIVAVASRLGIGSYERGVQQELRALRT